MTTTDTGLRVGRTRMPWVIATATLVGLAAAGWYWVVHPADLPTDPRERTAQTPVGSTIYVGLARTDRTIAVTGVRMAVEANVAVQVRLLRCVGGEIAVTTDPSVFCSRLEDPSGHDLSPDDSLVAEVTGDSPGAAYLRTPVVSFTDGLQRGSSRLGSPAVVTLLER